MLDNNKTALTHRVTAVAIAYLSGLGCKPIETEVPIRPGWIADVASYWEPTWTEVKKFRLHRKLVEMLGIDLADYDIMRSRVEQIKEAAKLIGMDFDESALLSRIAGDGPFTVLCEVKVTKADFAKSPGKWLAVMGTTPAHLCFIAYPHGIVDKLPWGWYGIETSADGRRKRKVHRSGRLLAQHVGATLDFVAAVGVRRHHRTTYAATRDWAKMYRAEESEKQVRYSTGDLLRCVAEWLQGEGYSADKTLKAALERAGLAKSPKYADEAIAFFEQLRERSGAGSEK